MLEGLEKIDWANLEAMFSRSAMIPECIRELRSVDVQVRERAFDGLWQLINHQDTIAEVTQYAVPFLVELLEYEDTPERHEIIGLLENIASSYEFFLFSTEWRRFPKQVDNNFNAFKAVSKGVDTYLKFLDSDNRLLRQIALHLLGKLGDLAPADVLSVFNMLIVKEQDVVIKAEAIYSSAVFISKSQPLIINRNTTKNQLVLLKEYIYDDCHFLIQLAAATAIIIVGEISVIPYRVIEIIVKFIEEDKEYSELQGFRRHTEYDHVRNTLHMLIEDSISYYSLRDEIPFLQDLFKVAFKGKKFTEKENLTKLQKMLLEALADSDGFWNHKIPKAILVEHNLPLSSSEMLSLVFDR